MQVLGSFITFFSGKEFVDNVGVVARRNPSEKGAGINRIK